MSALLRVFGKTTQVIADSRSFDIGRGAWRRHATSALAGAAKDFRNSVLAACVADEESSGNQVQFPEAFSSSGDDFEAVHQQSSAVASWPAHPLKHPEQLELAKALVAALPSMGLPPAQRGVALCAAYQQLLMPDQLFGVRSEGVARCALVVVVDEALVPAAVSEAAALLLRGHAVSLAAPRGQALGALEAVCAEMPPQLLQAVELAGEFVDLPEGVRAVYHIGGPAPRALWSHAPPQDFGGISIDTGAHGMLACAGALTLARTDMNALPRLPRARFEFNDEASDLLSLLTTELRSDMEFPEGTHRPRWAHSAYDRGVEEVHDLLDLLWAFREPWVANSGSDVVTGAALVAAPKHFILPSGGTTIPDELVKAAAISAMSPFREPVTLHAIGLGAGGLSKDPLRSFCRLVQSGKSGLEWRIVEHESRDDFILWLHSLAQNADCSDFKEAPALFGTVHSMEDDVWRLTAAAGGVQWGRLFTAEPLEQLRRWTRPVTKSSPAAENQDLCQSLRSFMRPIGIPDMEVILPLPLDED